MTLSIGAFSPLCEGNEIWNLHLCISLFSNLYLHLIILINNRHFHFKTFTNVHLFWWYFLCSIEHNHISYWKYDKYLFKSFLSLLAY